MRQRGKFNTAFRGIRASCRSSATVRPRNTGSGTNKGLIATADFISWSGQERGSFDGLSVSSSRSGRRSRPSASRGGAMIRRRNTGMVAAIGGSAVGLVLLTGLPAAKADDLADLRVNLELLQRRIDQLAQASPGPYVPSTPATAAGPGQPVLAGSFPRSFLIRGTDTSLRIGGIAWVSVLEYLKGAQMNTQLTARAASTIRPSGTDRAAPETCPIFRSTTRSTTQRVRRSISRPGRHG